MPFLIGMLVAFALIGLAWWLAYLLEQWEIRRRDD